MTVSNLPCPRFTTLTLIAVLALHASACADPAALLWGQPGRPDAALVRGALGECGYKVRETDAEGLPAALSAEPPQVLVLPYGGEYPAAAAEVIHAYLNNGGSLIAVGGMPLTRALFDVEGTWLPGDAGTQQQLPIPLDRQWKEGHAQIGVVLKMAPATESAPSRFSAGRFHGYAYLGTRPPKIPFADAVIAFEARSISGIPRLCVELAANDASRWKAIVSTGDAWREFRIHLADFVSYNNENRGGEGDYCRPGELRTLMLGFPEAMVGVGDKSFELRNLRIEEAAVPGAALRQSVRFKPAACAPRRWFGEPAAEQRAFPALFIQGDSIQGPLCRGDKTEEKVWTASPFAPPQTLSSKHLLHEQFKDATRVYTVPLLNLRTGGGALQPVAGFSALLTGPMQGGRHLIFGLPPEALRESSLAREAFADGLRTIREAILVTGIEPEITAEGDPPRFTVKAGVLTPPGYEKQLRLKCEMIFANQGRAVEPVDIEPGKQVSWASFQDTSPVISAERLACEFRLSATAFGGDPVPLLGNPAFRLDPHQAFLDTCEFIRETLERQGKLHGNRFLDSRGVRALFAAADIFEDARFRDTALRWVQEKVLDDQRDDGGYRMGYGAGKRGEACYVADGGEIAVCVAHAACHATGGQREALLQSLDHYMDYRESFRVDTGGIGVGWCLHDYGQRPVVPLDKPTKIFAPEKNTYTIGCTLGAAYAHARLRNDPALEQRAERDAGWLMERATLLNGGYVESYLYAHALTRDPQRKKTYEDFLRRTFRDKTVEKTNQDWWLTGGGRTALNLDGLIYWLHHHPEDTEVRLAIRRALPLMFSPDSPQSIPAIIASGHTLSHDEWIYICFGTLSLADVLHPMVSMEQVVKQNP